MDENTSAIRDIAYAEVERAFSNKQNITNYKRFMANFIQHGKRHDALFSPVPSMIYYSTDDIAKFFNSTTINKAIIHEAIKQTYYFKIANFNPRYAKDESTMAILCVVRYFIKHKMDQELNIAVVNMAFSGKMYPSVFHGKFPYTPAPHVMEYVVNQMMNSRFDIVKAGNLMGGIKNQALTWVNTYKNDRWEEFSDYDAQYLVQQLHSRLTLAMGNIADLFYEAHKNKDNLITYDSDNVTEDDFRLADNDSFKLNRIVDNTVSEIVNKNVNYTIARRASSNLVSFDELGQIMESVSTNKDNIPLIKEFINLLVTCYFAENAKSERRINDLSFLSFAIRPMPNTHEPMIIRRRELIELMLINNAQNFAKRRNRAATESAYFRAFNAYFAMMVQWANRNS